MVFHTQAETVGYYLKEVEELGTERIVARLGPNEDGRLRTDEDRDERRDVERAEQS